MQVMLSLFAIILLLEQLVFVPAFWRFRVHSAMIVLWLNAAWFGAVYGLNADIWVWLLGVIFIYKAVNLLRIVDNRMAAQYLYHVSRRASWVLSVLQISVLVLQKLTDFHLSGRYVSFGMAGLSVLISVSLLIIYLLNVRRARPTISHEAYADRDLPTVSVAIPARNETEDLDACLQSLLTSTYPKLEIIVLDDCSQERRTPEIIRGYAHDGVRFVAGSVPPEGWLAKNYAYAQLADQANGDIILFAGVDVRFSPDTLKTIVTSMLARDLAMISILPKNDAPPKGKLEALFVQPARYAWELALPRSVLPRPPVLSTAWAITKEALHETGSLSSVKRGNQPEGYFAKRVQTIRGGYAFMIADKTIGMESHKSFSEQRATAVRTRYPQLHRRIELTLLLSILELAVLIGPWVGLIWSLLEHRWGLSVLYAVSCIKLAVFYSAVVRLTYRKILVRSILLEPFAALYDVALLNYSMLRYEFGEVLWKGRNVCIPVMRVISHLPTFDR